MKVQVRISGAQLACVVALFLDIAVMLFLPAPMARAAGVDAWLAIPVAALLGGVPICLLLAALSRRHPGFSLSDIAYSIAGRWGGKLVSVVLGAFSVLLASLVTRDIMDFITVAVLPGTPRWITGLLFALTAGYAAYAGAEVIVRLALWPLVLVALAVLLMPIGLPRKMDLLRILPVFEQGPWAIIRAAWAAVGWFGEVWIFGEFLGMLDRPQRTLRNLWLGLGFAAVHLSALVLLCLLTFGPELLQRLTFPTYFLAHTLTYGAFLERTEIALVMVWLTGMVVKAGVCLWVAATAGTRLMGLRRGHWLVLPLIVASLGLTYLWPSFIAVENFASHWWTTLLLPVEVGVPALLLAVSWWRFGRRGRVSA